MKIVLTIQDVFDKGLWEYICERDGISVWARNEGQISDDETFSFSEEEAKNLGIIN